MTFLLRHFIVVLRWLERKLFKCLVVLILAPGFSGEVHAGRDRQTRKREKRNHDAKEADRQLKQGKKVRATQADIHHSSGLGLGEWRPGTGSDALATSGGDSAPSRGGLSEVNKYLTDTLGVEDLTRFNLTDKLYDQFRRGSGEKGEPVPFPFRPDVFNDEQKAQLLTRFSELSTPRLVAFSSAVQLPNNNNIAMLGEAGVGKSYTTDQLILMYSFGIVPDDIALEIGFTGNKEAPSDLENYFKGQVQFILVNKSLLSLDNTGRGKAMAKSEIRMASILDDLAQVAKQDFQKTGRRTVFVFEEFKTLPSLVVDAFLTGADSSGFKSHLESALERGSETGISYFAATTAWEWMGMMANYPGTVRRRFVEHMILEPTEQEAFDLLKNRYLPALVRQHNKGMDDLTLRYLIAMRKYFNSPPQAMPASVVKSLQEIFLWSRLESSGVRPDATQITFDDVFHFLIHKAQLPKDIWLGKPGEAPLQNLSSAISAQLLPDPRVTGPEGVVAQISRSIETAFLNGFREIPFAIIMAPSGAGKDTLVNALNQTLFGHEGRDLQFSLANASERYFAQIFQGLPDSDEPPLVVKALEGPHPHAAIFLNEGGDLPSALFNSLKVIAEHGIVTPANKNGTPRPLGLNPIILAGQWGEEWYEGMSDEEATDRYASLTEQDLIDALRKGTRNSAGVFDGKHGAVSDAVIQRAIRTGGIYALPPVPKSQYVNLVNIYLERIRDGLALNQIGLTVTERLKQLIAEVAIKAKRGSRGLDGVAKDFTERVVRETQKRGFAVRGEQVTLDAEFDVERLENAVIVATQTGIPESAVRLGIFEVSNIKKATLICQGELVGQNP